MKRPHQSGILGHKRNSRSNGTRPSALKKFVAALETWLLRHRDEESGLPISHVGDDRFENWCITYDAAVATLAYVALKRIDDARRVLDFYMATPETRRLGGVIEAVSATPPHGGQDWSVRTGANLWLGLAAYHLYKASGDTTYLTLATQIGDFALALQDRNPASPTHGGIRLGPAGDPSFDGDQHIGYDSQRPGFETIFATEVAVDGFALFNMLQGEAGLERFKSGRDLCFRWLKNVAWDAGQHRLNRGFYQKPDPAVATDVHSWAISALGIKRLDDIEPGAAEMMMSFIEEHCVSTVTYRTPGGTDVRVRGFDFVDRAALASLKRPAIVSPEWSFQVANAYKRLSEDAASLGRKAAAGAYARRRTDLLSEILSLASNDANGAGFPYATLGNVPVGHEYNTPAAGSQSAIGVSYGILALLGYDPLRPPAKQGALSPPNKSP